MLSYIQQHPFWSDLKPDINNVSLGYLEETSCSYEDTGSIGVKDINCFPTLCKFKLSKYATSSIRNFWPSGTRTLIQCEQDWKNNWNSRNPPCQKVRPWQVMVLSTIQSHATSGTILNLILSSGSSSVT